MAEGSSNNTILVVLVVGLVIWLLLSKAKSTITGVNTSVKQTYTPGTAASAVVTSVAPALGQFLSNALRPSQSSPSSNNSGYNYGGSSSFSDTSLPSLYSDNGGSAAFQDDTTNDYLLA